MLSCQSLQMLSDLEGVYAGEISSAMPDKKVTLVHANDRLLPNFPPRAGEVILKTLQKQGVEVGTRRLLETVLDC